MENLSGLVVISPLTASIFSPAGKVASPGIYLAIFAPVPPRVLNSSGSGLYAPEPVKGSAAPPFLVFFGAAEL